tara:strand:+ start:438 stop:1406 length:969 start_codon:yes stop_codon:yes gene_type:complete
MRKLLRHVDLCSGIGGFALGFQWAGLSRPVLFCDIEAWSRQVLDKHWPGVPIAEDVKELGSDPNGLVPDCDILTAGYPCQPFSQAGVRRGEKDDRHIWPQIFTIVQAKRPAWCVFENVSGHISLGLDQVLSDLEGEGYAVQPFVVPACAVGAPHRRDRVWIIAAHADSDGEPDGTINAESGCWQLGARNVGNSKNNRRDRWPAQARRERASDQSDKSKLNLRGEFGRSSKNVADATRKRMEGHRPAGEQEPQSPTGEGLSGRDSPRKGPSFWLPEPGVGRVAHGIPRRVDRLKGLGNAIVPQIAMQIGLTIKAVEINCCEDS